MRSLIYIGIILFGLSFIGCKKQLDQQPISDLSSALFWKTPEHALAGNAAIYDGIQKTLSGNYTEWGDARSDNFTYGGTGDNQIIIALNGVTATTAAANWNNLYLTISRANFAIKYIPGIAGLSDIQKNNYLAEAYGIRAYMYFYAVRVWGAVPVRLIPYENVDDSPNLARSPADSVINSVIIPDLQKAYTLVDPAANTVFELNGGGILSILAEVYMWQKNYAKVISTTDQLIATKKYGLITTGYKDYKDIFVGAGTKENIWTLNWNYIVDGGNGMSKIGSSSNTSNYYIDSVVLLKWETNKPDIRRSVAYDTTVANALQRIISIWKFYPQPIDNKPPVVPSTQQNQASLILYRWADILLQRAEALNWGNNDKAGAFLLVNQIRARANVAPLNPVNYATQLDVEKAILDERQLELFGEGKRWFDLVRTGRVLQVMDPLIRQRQKSLGLSQTGFTDPRTILWPISRDALARDPLLVQNPPYSN